MRAPRGDGDNIAQASRRRDDAASRHAPSDDCPVQFDCQAIGASGRNRNHIAQAQWDIYLSGTVVAPRDDGAIAFEGKTMA